MNNLVQRSISGVLFVALIVGSLLLCDLFFWSCMLVAQVLMMKEYFTMVGKQVTRERLAVFTLLGGVGIFIVSVLSYILDAWRVAWFIPSIVMVMLTFIVELFREKEKPLQNIALLLFPIFYIVLPFVALVSIGYWTGNFNKDYLLFLFCALWCYDSGAYVVGVSFGKHRLFERISPKKSWEGAFGGLFFTLIAAYVFYSFQTGDSGSQSLLFWIGAGVVVSVFGTLGDLVESMFKRSLNVKDSGSIMPGHGGMLDRFDSLLFAAPALWVYLVLLS